MVKRDVVRKLAREMREMLDRQAIGWVQMPERDHGLPLLNGLRVILTRREESWRLLLSREGEPPSENEIETFSAVFGVPEGADPVRRRHQVRLASGRKAMMVTVEMEWRESQPQRQVLQQPRPVMA